MESAESLRAKVIAYIERYQLFPEYGSIVVGVSGGADSLCLISLLKQLCGPSRHFPGISLQAAHLDHMLRGAASAEDAQAVANMMNAWQIPFTSGSIDVIALAKAEKRSLEEAARLARYRFLREVAQGRRIAVAHHADDQIETILLHWLRGSGLAGMAGMSPRQQDIIRPLLEITRAETQAYCRELGITPLEDLSNSDPRFLRNRIRSEVIPLLSELNPALGRTLLRNAEVARLDLDWLEKQVEQCWPTVVLAEEAQTIKLAAQSLQTLHPALQHHLLRRVTAQLCAGQSPLEPRHFVLLEHLLHQGSTQRERELHLPQRLRVRYQADSLSFERLSAHAEAQIAQSSRSAESREVLLSIPGCAPIPATPWLACAEPLSAELAEQVSLALQQENWPLIWQLLGPATPYMVYIDADVAGPELLVRTRRPGDRVQPLGMAEEKRVQDLLVDRHIRRAERDTLPLFFSQKHCLWVAGACLASRARLTSTTRRIVRLSIQPI